PGHTAGAGGWRARRLCVAATPAEVPAGDTGPADSGAADAAVHAFQNVLADQMPGRQLDGILPIEACAAQPCLRLFGRSYQTVQRDVTECIRADGTTQFIDGHPISDQLRPGREIDPV